MRLLIAGDYCPQHRVSDAFKRGEFDSVLSDIRLVTQSCDYSIVNLECPVTTGGEKPILKLGPNLHCDESGIEALKWAGVDCVSLANNHFFDFGQAGVDNTLLACDKYGLDYVGGGRNLDDASKVLYKRIKDKSIAIINCCEHEFSIASNESGGSNPLNPVKQYYTIREAKKKVNHVVVIVHGGHEHWQLPSPRMVETYRFFIDAGADVVVNHHQHCFSGYEIYNKKPIFYGLGNFCFDMPSRKNLPWNEGFLLLLSLNETISFEIIPYLQCSDNPSIIVQPSQGFDSRINALNSIIANSKELIMETDKYYKTEQNKFSSIFEPILNGYYLFLRNKGLIPSFISRKRKLQAKDYICCESHRDKVLFYLNNQKD